MSDKIIIVDFEDSFTYNIASVLFPFEKRLRVMSHQDFFALDFRGDSQEKVAIVLGPGPGHPSEFKRYFPEIQILREHKKIYLMGICLGHQIIGLMDGLCIKEAQKKLHGQNVEIEFQGKKLLVQRYNSLSVYEDAGGLEEVNVRKLSRGITYQFHPESIGTDSPELFFKELLNFIHS